MSDLQKGTVIKSTGSWYNVRMDEGEVQQCRIVGRFRLDGKKLTNPVAVGDRVVVSPNPKEKGIGQITQILERKIYVIRQSPRRKHDLHLLASNVDQAMLVMTIISPNLKQGFIDRFLLMTEPYDIPAIVIFNKADLYSTEELEIYDVLKAIYEDIGYQVQLISALTGEGMEALREKLHLKTTLISGQSGVGKSSLVNAIQPGIGLQTQELSDYSGKGQHTTTFAEMFPLETGGSIIDTPGIKTLSFNHFEPLDVAHNFREFFVRSEACKFGGKCLHRNEPKCAVKADVETGYISELRYLNYLTILEEIEEQNYWERNKGF